MERDDVLAQLGYSYKPANLFRKWMQALVASRPGAAVSSHVLPPLDRMTYGLSRGRFTVVSFVGGLPVLMLGTTGAKTGVRRTTPLLGFPCEGGIAVIGSNFGGEHTPGWVYNLRADPKASVTYRAQSIEVTCRLADEAQSQVVFITASRVYPGYARYRERAAHRKIAVYVLEAAKT